MSVCQYCNRPIKDYQFYCSSDCLQKKRVEEESKSTTQKYIENLEALAAAIEETKLEAMNGTINYKECAIGIMFRGKEYQLDFNADVVSQFERAIEEDLQFYKKEEVK